MLIGITKNIFQTIYLKTSLLLHRGEQTSLLFVSDLKNFANYHFWPALKWVVYVHVILTHFSIKLIKEAAALHDLYFSKVDLALSKRALHSITTVTGPHVTSCSKYANEAWDSFDSVKARDSWMNTLNSTPWEKKYLYFKDNQFN